MSISIKEFFEKTKEIMNGEEFDELRKREKKEIFDLFFETDLKKEFDGDSDAASCSTRITDGKDAIMIITFWSHAVCDEDFDDCLYDLDIEADIDDDWEKVSIDQAIDYIDIYSPKRLPLGILNTSILTAPGRYDLEDISLDQATELVHNNVLDSAVGHSSTAEIMNALLNANIPVNRQMFQQQPGQQALVFKLNGRPEEGKILTSEEIEQIGYKFQLLTRIE